MSVSEVAKDTDQGNICVLAHILFTFHFLKENFMIFRIIECKSNGDVPKLKFNVLFC